MKARAYVLIKTVKGKGDEVSRILRGKPGVALLDCVAGPPDIVMVAEAENNQALANLTIQALASVEDLTEDTQVLPVCCTEAARQWRGLKLRKGAGHD